MNAIFFTPVGSNDDEKDFDLPLLHSLLSTAH